MDFNHFAAWPILASYTGATAMTMVIVQFTKGALDKLVHIPTQLYSYIVALAVLYCGYYFTGQLTISSAVLILFNGFLVSIASNGGHQNMSQLMTQVKKVDQHD